MRYFSMFSGAGGFELGIGERGKCIGFSEIDKYCNQLLKNKFPGIRNYGDATKINPSELPDFDMLCGGFPCQAFSIAGKRRGFKDTRGTLFFEIARILEAKRPKIVFLENVKGLLNHEEGKTFSIILSTLSQLGYDVQWMVLNSKFFGVPQNRERVFIIGSLREEPRPEILPIGEINKINNGEYEEQVARCLSSTYYKQGQWEQYIMSPKMIGHLQIEGERRINDCPLEINEFLKDNKKGLTIKEIANLIDEPLSKVEHYFRTDISRAIPKPDVWLKLQGALGFPDTYNKQVSELEKFYVEFEQTRRVYSDDMSPTLTSTPIIVAMRGRNPENPSDRIAGHPTEQRLEPNLKGTTNALTSVQKDNLVIMDLYNNKEHTDRCPTLTEPHHNNLRVREGARIRKLTPLEFERLQGFPENWTEDFSDTQRWKMMGNAVTVNVIKAIMEKL